MAKTLLNQTISRPMLTTFALQKIYESPSALKDKYLAEREKFFSCIEPIKTLVKEKLTNMYPKDNLLDKKTNKTTGDMGVLAKYDQTRQEDCFYFTDRESDLESNGYGHTDTSRNIFAKFCEGGKGHGGGYSKKEIGNLSNKDTAVVFYDDLVESGVDMESYFLYDENGGRDYRNKRMSWAEHRARRDSIKEKSKQFTKDYGLHMEFETPNSTYQCHQRARLVTPQEYQILYKWCDDIEGIHLKFDKYRKEMKTKFKAYVEVINSSRTLEGVIEQWPEAQEMASKIRGTGTALTIVSADSMNIIQQDMMSRQAQDKVAVVITPTENVWGNA